MPGPGQYFRIFASKNPRISRSVTKKQHPESIRRKTAYDLFHGQVLRVRVRFVGEQWGEYRIHEDSSPLVNIGRKPLLAS
jgi:hypothetical protein